MTVDAKTTGSRTVDRVLTYSTVQKGKAKAGEFIESSSVLSTYVAPAAQKSVAMASNVASATSGYVPGVVKTPVKNVVAKVDDLGDRTLQRLEDVTARSQVRLGIETEEKKVTPPPSSWRVKRMYDRTRDTAGWAKNTVLMRGRIGTMVYNYATGREQRKRDIAKALGEKAVTDVVNMPWRKMAVGTVKGAYSWSMTGARGVLYTSKKALWLSYRSVTKTTSTVTSVADSWVPIEIHWKKNYRRRHRRQRTSSDSSDASTTSTSSSVSSVSSLSPSEQEKLQKYVKDTLPLDSDDENVEDSSLNVKERVVVNGKKAIEKVVPGSVVTVAVKSVSATKAAASAASTAYGAMTRENIVGAYNQITVDNAKGLTKDTVKGAYNQITKENAKAVVKGTADAAKTVTKASIDTTKAVVGTSLATTKAVVDTSLAATQAGYGAAKSVAGAGVKVAGATYSTAVALKDYAMGSKPADVPVAEPETPKAA